MENERKEVCDCTFSPKIHDYYPSYSTVLLLIYRKYQVVIKILLID